MTVDEAKEASAKIEAAAKELNRVIADGALKGLLVEASILDVTQIGGNGMPMVSVSTKVRPSDID